MAFKPVDHLGSGAAPGVSSKAPDPLIAGPVGGAEVPDTRRPLSFRQNKLNPA